jgi:hypothetical protein
MDDRPHNTGETMENQTSFDLNAAIQGWRASLGKKLSGLGKDDLDELESHVRDSSEALIAKGLTDEEAFLIAIRRAGSQEQLASEFSKTVFAPALSTNTGIKVGNEMPSINPHVKIILIWVLILAVAVLLYNNF